MLVKKRYENLKIYARGRFLKLSSNDYKNAVEALETVLRSIMHASKRKKKRARGKGTRRGAGLAPECRAGTA